MEAPEALDSLDLDAAPPLGEPGEEEEAEGPALRDCLLNQSTDAAEAYLLGAFSLEPEEGSSISCSLIGVAVFESRVVVAVPHSVWHRQTARRYLPRGALAKAVAAEVLAAKPDNRAEPHPHFKVRVWIGLLDPALEACCIFGDEEEGAERGFQIQGSDQEGLP